MKRALVSGAGGFIGGHLVKRLKEEGFWVRGVDKAVLGGYGVSFFPLTSRLLYGLHVPLSPAPFMLRFRWLI